MNYEIPTIRKAMKRTILKMRADGLKYREIQEIAIKNWDTSLTRTGRFTIGGLYGIAGKPTSTRRRRRTSSPRAVSLPNAKRAMDDTLELVTLALASDIQTRRSLSL